MPSWDWQAHVLYMDCFNDSFGTFKDIFEILMDVASIVTATVACIAYRNTKKEYKSHLEREKTALLSKYNERYSTDPNIQKVVNYLLWKDDHQKCNAEVDKVHYGGEDEDSIKPTKNQVELFMRFFEEIQISVEAGRMDIDKVNDLFAYYAHELSKIGNDLLPDDYIPNAGKWEHFQKFIETTNINNK